MIHIVLTKRNGYTEFRTSHTPNRTGSEPCGVEETIERLRKVYGHFSYEVL